MIGTGALTRKFCAVDVPLLVVVTVTGTDADEATSEAEIWAFNCVLSRYVVGMAWPFQLMAQAA